MIIIRRILIIFETLTNNNASCCLQTHTVRHRSPPPQLRYRPTQLLHQPYQRCSCLARLLVNRQRPRCPPQHKCPRARRKYSPAHHQPHFANHLVSRLPVTLCLQGSSKRYFKLHSIVLLALHGRLLEVPIAARNLLNRCQYNEYTII